MNTLFEAKVPVLVDTMDDRVSTMYRAKPTRIYLIGDDGRVAYNPGIGPFGYNPVRLGREIETYLAKRAGCAGSAIQRSDRSSTPTSRRGAGQRTLSSPAGAGNLARPYMSPRFEPGSPRQTVRGRAYRAPVGERARVHR